MYERGLGPHEKKMLKGKKMLTFFNKFEVDIL